MQIRIGHMRKEESDNVCPPIADCPHAGAAVTTRCGYHVRVCAMRYKLAHIGCVIQFTVMEIAGS